MPINRIHSHHEKFELNELSTFGELSINEILEIGDSILESNIIEEFQQFTIEYKSTLTKQDITELCSGINETLDDLITDFSGLEIPNLWCKRFFLYRLESNNLRDIISTISSKKGADKSSEEIDQGEENVEEFEDEISDKK